MNPAIAVSARASRRSPASASSELDRSAQSTLHARRILTDQMLRIVDELAPPIRPQSFRETPACSIALSSHRSATSRFNLAVSSSRCRSRRISDGISPAYFWRHA
jgi:hypothetical protein